MHVHVRSPDGECKYWLEPEVALAKNTRLATKQLNEIKSIVEDHKGELIAAWQRHFGDSSN